MAKFSTRTTLSPKEFSETSRVEKKEGAVWENETIFDPLFSTLEGFNTLFIGNSLPIRQADASFFPEKPVKIFANRGLSGIDGNIATASGIADVRPGKTAAIIGDQTFLHDLNSLPLAKNLTLIVINNGGGQIFFPPSHRKTRKIV